MVNNSRKSTAYIDGWLAHKKDAPSCCNPYSETSHAASHAEWLSGWRERFNAIKHNLDLSLDNWVGYD